MWPKPQKCPHHDHCLPQSPSSHGLLTWNVSHLNKAWRKYKSHEGVKRSETMSFTNEPFSLVPPEAMTTEEGPECFVPSEGGRRRNHYPCMVSFNTEALDLNISICNNL